MFDGDIIEYLVNYTKKGSSFGVERTRALLNLLGSPDKDLKIIHIAGTNGKGSTAAYMSHILRSAGKKCGAFTSPWVIDYCEQFAVDCKPLPREKLNGYLERAYERACTMRELPTAFEIETAGALYAFREEGCGYAVVECGLGGLLDATNAIAGKEVALITSVSLEHTAVLGGTLREICAHKAGIIKDCPALVSSLQAEEVREYFSAAGARICDGVEVMESGLGGVRFSYGGEEYRTALCGSAQAYNAALAIECANLLKIDKKCVKAGISAAEAVGRVQVIRSGGRIYILDGGHNPAGLLPLVETVKSLNGKKSLAFGCLSDKDVRTSAKMLNGIFDECFTFPPDSYRAMDGEKIHSALGGTRTQSVSEALGRATGDIVAVSGSFTNIREAMQWIEKGQ